MTDQEKLLTELEASALTLDAMLCIEHRSEIMSALFRTAGTRHDAHSKTLGAMIGKALGMKTKDIRADITRHKADELKASVDNALYPFFLNDTGGVCRWKRDRDGIETHVELSNFSARIVEDVTVDNGLEITRRFAIEGGTSHRAFPRITIKTSEFTNLNWCVNSWGNLAVIKAGQANRDYLREYIQVVSNHLGVNHREVFGHSGWRKVNGAWVFLHANGAIGGEGIEVELPGEYRATGRYCLPAVPEHEKEGLDAIFAFINVGKSETMLTCLAYTFLCILTSLLDPMPSFSLYFHGERDTLKTTIAILMLAFFGSHTKQGLANFDSTANAVMHRAAILKDVLMVVDDYYPSGRAKEAMQKESIAQRIIRDLGNRTGRARLNPDATEKPIPYPKGLILITGEELPGLQSTLSRVLALEFAKGDIDTEKLTEAQESAVYLPHAMTSFILWIQERIETVQEDFKRALSELRKAGGVESTSKKVPEHVGFLRYAWKLFCLWMQDKGAVDDELRQRYLLKGYQAFDDIADRHMQRIEGEDPISLFYDIISTQLHQGLLRIEGKESGYSGKIGGDAGLLLGYHDERYYYLLPTPLWHAVTTYTRMEGGFFPFSKATLYDTMARRGMIEKKDGKHSHNVRIRGNVMKVIMLRRGENDPFNAIDD